MRDAGRSSATSAFTSARCSTSGAVVYDPESPDTKLEPFYFDARCALNPHSRDIGFAPNDLHYTTVAFPAVEFYCLVGLQRRLPVRPAKRRLFDYSVWDAPLSPSVLPAVVGGLVPAAWPPTVPI